MFPLINKTKQTVYMAETLHTDGLLRLTVGGTMQFFVLGLSWSMCVTLASYYGGVFLFRAKADITCSSAGFRSEGDIYLSSSINNSSHASAIS